MEVYLGCEGLVRLCVPSADGSWDDYEACAKTALTKDTIYNPETALKSVPGPDSHSACPCIRLLCAPDELPRPHHGHCQLIGATVADPAYKWFHPERPLTFWQQRQHPSCTDSRSSSVFYTNNPETALKLVPGPDSHSACPCIRLLCAPDELPRPHHGHCQLIGATVADPAYKWFHPERSLTFWQQRQHPSCTDSRSSSVFYTG
ncbi:hypothetical protein MRX96_002370 [Rhipicephalus microplus]